VPGSRCPVHERTQALVIVIHSDVDKMPPYPTDQRSVLHGYRLVPLASAKVIGVFDRPRKARLSGFACHMPARPPAISAPIHRKSQKVKAARTFPASLIYRRPSELYQTCLFRVKTQVVLLKTLIQNSPYHIMVRCSGGICASFQWHRI
jgi:hypothetical protein